MRRKYVNFPLKSSHWLTKKTFKIANIMLMMLLGFLLGIKYWNNLLRILISWVAAKNKWDKDMTTILGLFFCKLDENIFGPFATYRHFLGRMIFSKFFWLWVFKPIFLCLFVEHGWMCLKRKLCAFFVCGSFVMMFTCIFYICICRCLSTCNDVYMYFLYVVHHFLYGLVLCRLRTKLTLDRKEIVEVQILNLLWL